MDRLSYGNEGARQKGRAKLVQMPEETIQAFMAGIARALRPRGHLFLWLDKYHLCEGVGPWVSESGLAVVDMITWNKGRMGMGYRTRRQSEYLAVLQKPPQRAKDVWTDRAMPDVIEEVVPRRKEAHPHRKPIALQARLIAAVTQPGDLVIDPAAGSFSVLASCKRVEDRRFFGADLTPMQAATAD
jgi:site-specific DNA-methyltransferase (adenine-specific)